MRIAIVEIKEKEKSEDEITKLFLKTLIQIKEKI